MKVYIEKSFIEKFEADRKSLHQSRLYNIIINYPQLELFIDFEYKVDPYNNNIQYETLMIYSKQKYVDISMLSRGMYIARIYSLDHTFRLVKLLIE